MAKKGFDIDVGMNTREVQRGAGDIESALGEVADSLDDVARDADKAGREIGDELTEGAKDATRSVDRLERSFKDMADASKRETRTAADALKRNTKEATSAAARDLGELKDEAVQNASETFSSFDGSVESLVDGIQGTFGGIVSSIGPIGALAGAAAAVGLGLITAELQASAEKAAQTREETTALTKEIIDAGGNIDQVALSEKVREWSLEIADNKEWWEIWQEAAVTNLQQVNEIAEQTGHGVQSLFNAMSGLDDAGSLDLLEEMEARLEEVNTSLEGLGRARAGGTERAQELGQEKAALETATAAIRERMQIQEQSIEEARQSIELTEESTRIEREAAAATEARADAASTLQREIDKGLDSWSEYVNAETGAIDPAAYIAGMTARREATANFNANVQTLATQFGLTHEEIQAILDQGLDFAPHLQSIIDSGAAEALVTEIRAGVDGGQAIIDGTAFNTTVTTTADTSTAVEQLDAASGEREAGIVAEASTTTAARQLDAVAAQPRTAKITAAADLTAAAAALDRLVEERTITIRARVLDQRGVEIP